MSILSMCEYVYKCMGMYDLFLCVEMEGLYHINQQLSELLACILLDDEVMFLVILERKVDMNWFLLGMGGESNRRIGISKNVPHLSHICSINFPYLSYKCPVFVLWTLHNASLKSMCIKILHFIT